MDIMTIENAKYQTATASGSNVSIQATIDGTVWSVPISADNRHYAEILRQVDAGTLTIEDAD